MNIKDEFNKLTSRLNEATVERDRMEGELIEAQEELRDAEFNFLSTPKDKALEKKLLELSHKELALQKTFRVAEARVKKFERELDIWRPLYDIFQGCERFLKLRNDFTTEMEGLLQTLPFVKQKAVKLASIAGQLGGMAKKGFQPAESLGSMLRKIEMPGEAKISRGKEIDFRILLDSGGIEGCAREENNKFSRETAASDQVLSEQIEQFLSEISQLDFFLKIDPNLLRPGVRQHNKQIVMSIHDGESLTQNPEGHDPDEVLAYLMERPHILQKINEFPRLLAYIRAHDIDLARLRPKQGELGNMNRPWPEAEGKA